MTGPVLSAAVVGAGIGGLTAALSLLEVGVRVRVYEQATALTEIGAGLQLSPNCSRVLHYLGLGPALARVGVRPVALERRGWRDGGLLGSYPVNGDPLQFGSPHYPVYRPDLLEVLVSAMPDGVVRLDHRVTEVHQDSESATVVFAGGGSATVDFVIGADGIHSVIRAALFGADAPTFSGTVAYRGLLPAAKVAGLRIPNTSTKWWGPVPEHHLVHYHIRGGSLVNVVGVVPEDWHTESWTARGRVPDLVAAFDSFHPPIPELVGAVEEVYKFAIYDRPPLAEWTGGRGSLLGGVGPAGGREPSDGPVHGPGGRDGDRGRRDTGQVREPLRGRRAARAFGVRPGQAGADGSHAARLARRHVRHLGQQGVGVWVRPLRCLTPVIAARPPGRGCRGPIAARRRRPFCRPGR